MVTTGKWFPTQATKHVSSWCLMSRFRSPSRPNLSIFSRRFSTTNRGNVFFFTSWVKRCLLSWPVIFTETQLLGVIFVQLNGGITRYINYISQILDTKTQFGQQVHPTKSNPVTRCSVTVVIRSFRPTCPQTFHPKLQKRHVPSLPGNAPCFRLIFLISTQIASQKMKREPQQSTALKKKNTHMTHEQVLFVLPSCLKRTGIPFNLPEVSECASCCSHLSECQNSPHVSHAVFSP